MGNVRLDRIAVADGIEIFFKDWGEGQPILFSHGWPVSADDWDCQMLFFLNHGFRVIAHDRRGHGRSTQTSTGNDMNTYADDLAALINHLDLREAVLVGHSTGGGEVSRYLGRHGTTRVAKAALLGSVTPIMVRGAANPIGLPQSVFDDMRTALARNRAQFFRDITIPFYGYNRIDADVSDGARQHYWNQGMMGSIKSQYDCIRAFSETDFTEDLRRIDIPVLVMHGDDDQIVPIQSSAHLTAKLLKNPVVKIYPGKSHGFVTTHAAEVNADLLAFINS